MTGTPILTIIFVFLLCIVYNLFIYNTVHLFIFIYYQIIIYYNTNILMLIKVIEHLNIEFAMKFMTSHEFYLTSCAWSITCLTDKYSLFTFLNKIFEYINNM